MMATEVGTAEGNLLSKKWGPAPVWVYALLGLVAAWLYSKYKSSSAAASTATTDTTGTGETTATAPEFIIENNEPVATSGTPSAPVTTPVSTPPVVTPPGKTPAPPVSSKPAPPPGTGSPVQANPIKSPLPPVKGTPVSPIKGTPAKKPAISYRVVAGDTLSSIAAKYHTTAAALYAYNTTPGVRPASTIATLKKRGPNLIYSGETILVPQS